ncbi:SDR family oxidoreductase [Paenibacillus daejeonensis]|uniref:SDR family oxidoreductase n=1 Tax=Paenibacillus daejeonensis TaxID=135193 RepID=UPI0003811982|nr:SDR family oxidoreductase [Paenibacillus daejeonensis]
MSKIVVTGGGGFIGSHLVRALLSQGKRVTVLDNFSTGHPGNLSEVQADCEIIEGDIRDYATVHKAVRGATAVLHQAALPSVPRSIRDPLSSNEVNITGTLHVLQASAAAGVERLVFAGSSSVYGNQPGLPRVETMRTAPASPYALNKLAGETYARLYAELFGLETVTLRYFNVFGPRQNPDSEYAAVIPKFIRAMLSGQSPHIHGDGRQSRDFTYIDNVIEANLLALKAPLLRGEAANIGGGGSVALADIVDRINGMLGLQIEPVHGPDRQGDVKHSHADIGLAERLLGYRPVVAFDEGLKRTLGWYQENKGVG